MPPRYEQEGTSEEVEDSESLLKPSSLVFGEASLAATGSVSGHQQSKKPLDEGGANER